MRLSTRLLSNAATNYLRLAATLAIGLFTTWYMLGAIGVVGFGLIALASSSIGLSHAVEKAFRFGLVRDLAAAIASGDQRSLRRTVSSAFRLSLQAVGPLMVFVGVLAGLAWAGAFNTPPDLPGLENALAILMLAEGVHGAVRLLSAPHIQALFAAQEIALDNLLMVVSRATYALSAVVVFGWLLPDRSLALQVIGFAVSRVTLQLADVGLGIWLAKRRIPGLKLDRSAYDEAEYRAVRSTVWHSSQVALLQNLNSKFMAVLINLFFGLTYNGLWQIVVQLASFVRMFSEGLLRGIAPLATHLQERGRAQTVIDLMARSIRYQLAITLPAVLALGIWARRLLELWVGDRLAADPNLAASGIGSEEALTLATTMLWIMLAWQIVRATFYGVENILYGMGEVRSYGWFSKWGTLIAVGSAAALMAWLDQPIAAPIALLLAQTCFSAGAVLSAARRRVGLPVAATLRRALPRPLAASLLLLSLVAPSAYFFADVGLLGLVALVAASALVYCALAAALIPEADERPRMMQLLRRGARWAKRPSLPRPSDPTA